MKFRTTSTSVSVGNKEFFAGDGIIEIPDEYVSIFVVFIGNALLPFEVQEAPSTTESPEAPKPPRSSRAK